VLIGRRFGVLMRGASENEREREAHRGVKVDAARRSTHNYAAKKRRCARKKSSHRAWLVVQRLLNNQLSTINTHTKQHPSKEMNIKALQSRAAHSSCTSSLRVEKLPLTNNKPMRMRCGCSATTRTHHVGL
jgi:hypothetical protein